MGHAHHLEYGHTHEPASYSKALLIGVLLNILFIVIEAVYGIIGKSLALLADAGHNLSDVLGLLVAWTAIWLGERKPTRKRTYGYKSSSILAALFNAVCLLIAVGVIAWEAIQRFSAPAPVTGSAVIIVAFIGIVINGITAMLFMSGRKGDLNIKGAFLHMAADAGVSLGVVIAGFIILFTGWEWVDPVVSLIIAAVILIGTWGLLRDSINLALNAVPASIDLDEIKAFLQAIPTVIDVHDLHVWGMSTTETALTAHLIRTEINDNDAVLKQINEALHNQFGIHHTTIQIEKGTYVCELASEDSI
ncbi:cation transporter [Sporolactobacillus sp. THM7-7]|nr:cation transporter [Sporolactobacillus sp. THM7-7]